MARFEVVKAEVHVVRLIFAWVGLDRMSLRDVTRRLKQLACQTRRSTPERFNRVLKSRMGVSARHFGHRIAGNHTVLQRCECASEVVREMTTRRSFRQTGIAM